MCWKLFTRGKILIQKYIEFAKYFALCPIGKMLYSKQNLYLFSERGTDARDNGYYMFRYVRKKYPDKHSVYIIDKRSKDYPKVAEIGEVVQYRSLKHYLMFIGAKYRISTHVMGYSPHMLFFIDLHRKWHIPGKHIFLQHGVIKDDLVGLYKENIMVDCFICGAKPEYDYVSRNYHYNKSEVQYTGLARFDGLQLFTLKKQILVMPTWRVYCNNMSEDQFLSSKYYQNWNEFITNKWLLQTLHKNKMQLIFYPHYEMQKFVYLFKKESSDVIIADFDHYDVQTLLKESMLLVTDFSSVFFDFGYMKKPCIYFQFDKDQYRENQYKEGYFSYEKMGFGQVVEQPEQVVELVTQYIEADCKTPTQYYERMNAFFPLHDSRNCERIFNAIEEL